MEDPLDRGRRLGRKYSIVGFAIIAAGFTLWTSQQIIFGALGVGAAPPAGTDARGLSSPCIHAIRGLRTAVERGVVASAGAPDEASAVARYQAALAPEWNFEQASYMECARDGQGDDAFAALLRYRGAGEAIARRQAGELGLLRSDLSVYLPPEGLPK